MKFIDFNIFFLYDFTCYNLILCLYTLNILSFYLLVYYDNVLRIIFYVYNKNKNIFKKYYFY